MLDQPVHIDIDSDGYLIKQLMNFA